MEAYFRDPDALACRFTEEQIRFGSDVLARGNRWEIAILDWVIINWTGMTAQSPKLIVTTYEDLVRDPVSFTDEVLVSRLQLPERETMLTTFHEPSNSSSMSVDATKAAIVEGDTTHLLSRWQEKVSVDEVRIGQQVLDVFGITRYGMQSAFPLD